MPTVLVPESFESSKTNSAKSSVEEYSQINSLPNTLSASSTIPPITPRTDFAIRQANNLVERICRENGVEAPKYSFAGCLSGQENQISSFSATKHTSVLRMAEYLHKRGQIERDYAVSIQKLNRSIVQTGDTDERLGQLIVMGEKTAASHMDWARKIGEHRIVEDLKTLCGENEERRRYLLAELRKTRAIWSKAVGAFEKVRKNRDKALKAADSAQLALDTAISRGNASKTALARLQEDAQQKNERAQAARDEYARAMAALTQRQSSIFKEQIPQCMEGFEKMERTRIAAVRSSLIQMAQVHLAVSDVEMESGQRWLKSLISLSIDDEIEMFIDSVEERSVPSRIMEDDYEIGGEEPEDRDREESRNDAQQPGSSDGFYHSSANLTGSESDLLRLSSLEIDDSSDPSILKERRDKLAALQIKLTHQIEALEKMQEAYAQPDDSGNQATLEAVRTSIRGISREFSDNSAMIEQIDAKLSNLRDESSNNDSNHYNYRSSATTSNMRNPMESILEELNRLDQRRAPSTGGPIKMNLVISSGQENKRKPRQQKQKSLSRSFDDILNSGEAADLAALDESASPKATGLKLPGTQWTAASIFKSNEEIARGDYFCAEDEEEEAVERFIAAEGPPRARSPGQIQSPRRKSLSQSTPSDSANILVPEHRQALFPVQALYNFIGRKETDELDLRTGEILSVYEASGEWWEAENEAGARGYIPFNYIIRI